MATINQIEAARRNGARSKGPATQEGKDRSSRNATKHGMFTNVVVLSNESQEHFDNLAAEYIEDCRPETRREHDLVGQIVSATWRLNRIQTFETAAIDLEMDKQRHAFEEGTIRTDEQTRAAMAFAALANESSTLSTLGRCESRLRRTVAEATEQLAEMQRRRKNKKCENEPPETAGV